MTDFIWRSWLGFGVAVAIGVLAALLLVAVVWLIVRLLTHMRPAVAKQLTPVRNRLRVVLVLVALQIVIDLTWPHEPSHAPVNHALLILNIIAGAWLITAVLAFLIARTLARFRLDVADNRVARRVHTQMSIVKRLVVVVIWVLAIGSALLTFPGAEGIGTSVLASAGLVSVIAGLAAQSTLGNLVAGLQLAFSDAIRVDDVVIANGEWGRIEEITLTYVVLKTWDVRRLVLPSTYFTTTPFENWTRHSSELLGAVEFDLDWRVSPNQMRTELDRMLPKEELWNGETKSLQITNAVAGYVRVRIVLSANSAGDLWDLRCIVREHMVEWLHSQDPGSLPRSRVVVGEQEPRIPGETSNGHHRTEGIFSGSEHAEARKLEFTGAIRTIDMEEEER